MQETSNQIIHGFKDDALKVRGSHEFTNVNVVDSWTFLKPWLWHRAHIDGWQIIPQGEKANEQYSLAEIEELYFYYCSLASKSKIQPIFCGDGIIKYLEVYHCVFKTSSAHHITINGLLDGFFESNCVNGTEIRPLLKPARIGGGNNIWILGFANTYEYQDIENVNDQRKTPQERGINLINFDVEGFKEETNGLKDRSGNNYAKAAAEIAVLYGDRV